MASFCNKPWLSPPNKTSLYQASDFPGSVTVIRNHLQIWQKECLYPGLYTVSLPQYTFNRVYTHWDLHISDKLPHLSSVLLFGKAVIFLERLAAFPFTVRFYLWCKVRTRTQKSPAIYLQCPITTLQMITLGFEELCGKDFKDIQTSLQKSLLMVLQEGLVPWLFYYFHTPGLKNIVSKRVNKMVNFMLYILKIVLKIEWMILGSYKISLLEVK